MRQMASANGTERYLSYKPYIQQCSVLQWVSPQEDEAMS